MTRFRRIAILAASAAAAAVLTGGGLAFALNVDDEGSVTGPEADRARAAALTSVGGGSAQGVEREGDGGASWEVEVVTRDGRQTEVLLDSRYRVVAVDGDGEDDD